MRRLAVAAALVLAFASGCSGPAPQSTPLPEGAGGGPTKPAGQRTESVPLGDRPFTVYVPGSYQPGTPAPLLIGLHGYAGSGSTFATYLAIAPEADKRGILYATPDGTTDTRGEGFWNATDACCNFYGATVDDAGYLTDVIRTVSARYTVDPKRVYLIGLSNGAFMSYRMACDHAELIAAVAALNGAMWSDPSNCRPSQPVSVLSIRGTADTVIRNEGGSIAGHTYPSTEATINDWVALDGCSSPSTLNDTPVDMDSDVAGAETFITTYSGCRQNSSVQSWTLHDGQHVPHVTEHFVPAVLDFLLAQSL
jgi:polyhydroxybutyrate depolymerase